MSSRSVSAGSGSLVTGAVTAVALAVQTGLAAIVGIVLAREFGRSAETDGFFAAYGVFIVVVLAATAIRVAVLPPLARAREERCLGAEVAAYALALAALAVPLLLAATLASDPLAWLLTGNGSAGGRRAASDALPWMMLAAVFQLYAGLAASALAALDDYVVAAVGFALGSVAGLAFILVRIDADGIQAILWGMALNGAIALLVPAAALARRARAQQMPVRAARPIGLSFRARLAEMGTGVALPLAMQAIYLVCIPLAAREGVGSVTSFGYAYLIVSAVVAVTASSLGMVTSVPLTRTGLDAARTVRHVVSSSWIAIVVIGGVAGVFGLAGARIVQALLGADYGADVGSEVGRLVVVLSLWALASVGVAVTFPLVFVAARGRGLPLIALGAVAVQIPLAIVGRELGGLDGIALALATTTALSVAVMLVVLQAAAGAARGLGAATLTVAALALAAFVPPWFAFGPVTAAASGVVLYCGLIAAFRPPGLVASWRYLRALV